MIKSRLEKARHTHAHAQSHARTRTHTSMHRTTAPAWGQPTAGASLCTLAGFPSAWLAAWRGGEEERASLLFRETRKAMMGLC